MACLPDDKILAYLEGECRSIEQSLIRDHLLICPNCRHTADSYAELQKILAQPVTSELPAWLVPQVMKRIYPEIPKYTSIAALIAASFIFFVTWIYIYFDFSRNSLIQALQLTAKGTSGWLVTIIKGISTIYNSVQAAFKACNAFLNILLNIRLGGPVLIASALAFSGLLLFVMIRLLLKKPGAEKQ
jgi:predicted anti-sigma-YlaC factor YlaD